MAQVPASHSGPGNILSSARTADGKAGIRRRKRYRSILLLVSAALLSPLILAQDAGKVTGVDPASGKVNDSVTVSGTDLGKGSVSAVFLSDDKDDFKATIVEQAADKIVVKIPQVKAGSYHISVQVGDKILIKPVRFTVEE
jgi:hypothetical protein